MLDRHGPRARLLRMTSEAAAEVAGQVDAVFLDGCHLFACVSQDLRLWTRQLRRGVATLLSGHDFSPQWPGVVQAVHEHRRGREVHLASDWLYWWFQQTAPAINRRPQGLRRSTVSRMLL